MAAVVEAVSCSGRQSGRGAGYAERLLSGLDDLRRGGVLCDVVLRVGQLALPAHRAVLAACSPYFRAMFTAKLSEHQKETIDFKDIHPSALSQLVSFAYTGAVDVNDDNVLELLPAACLLQVDDVIRECCDYLESQLHPSNCIGIAKFAEMHACWELHRKCLTYQRQHFKELTASQEFMQISNTKEIIELISKDELVVPSELDLVTALESWIMYDVAERKQHLLELMSHVRFVHVSLDYLKTMMHNPMINSVQTLSNIVKSAIEYKTHGRLRLNQSHLQHSPHLNTTPRQPATILCAIGGKNGLFTTVDSVDTYAPATQTWQELTPLPTCRFQCSAATLNGQLYVVGGLTMDPDDSGTHHDDSSVVRWGGDSGDGWTETAPMEQPRSALAVAVVGGYLYAVGGYNKDSYLSTVERYSPEEDRWERRAPMLQGRSCFCAVGLEEKVYALGGYGPPCLSRLVECLTSHPHVNNSPNYALTSRGLDSMEQYDPTKDSWKKVSPMREKRINFGAASVCGFVYAVGGHNGVAYLSSMERYDPYTDQWTPVTGMGQPRTGLGVGVIGNHLYVVGGHSGALYLKTAQQYDPFTDTWSRIQDMNSSRSSFGFAGF